MSVSFDEDVLYVEVNPAPLEITIDPVLPTIDVSNVPLTGTVDFTEEIVTLEVNDSPALSVAPEVVAVEIAAVGLQGEPGPEGPPGPQGPPGDVLATVAYTHEQVTPEAVWEVTHNLGYAPNVTIVDSGGTAQYGEITYTGINTLTLTFLASFGGKAYCT